AYGTLEDTALVVSAPGVLANDFDQNGGSLSVSLASLPAVGSVSLAADGSFVYTPAAGWNSEMDPFGTSPVFDSFTYLVTDDSGLTATASVSIYVAPVIDQPVARDDAYTLVEDTV